MRYLIIISSFILMNCSTTKPAAQQTTSTKVTGNLPFGCEQLESITTSFYESDPDNYGQLLKPQGDAFNNIQSCMSELQQGQKETLPNYVVITNLILNFDLPLEVNLNPEKDEVLYRLPNYGDYECYYIINEVSEIPNVSASAGFLFVHLKNRAAHWLNAYQEYNSDQNIGYRYFLAKSDGIQLFEGNCYDDGCGLNYNRLIEINKSKINVSKIKN